MMSFVGMHFVCGINSQGRATSIKGIAFIAQTCRRVSWFKDPLPLEEPLEVDGPISKTSTGERIGVLFLDQTRAATAATGGTRQL